MRLPVGASSQGCAFVAAVDPVSPLGPGSTVAQAVANRHSITLAQAVGIFMGRARKGLEGRAL
jgi:hypothetical protein